MAEQGSLVGDAVVDEELRRHHLPEGFFAPEDSISYALALVANRVSRILESMYGSRYGLTVVGWRVLAILQNRAPLSAKELAELTAMGQVAISRALDQLVRKKLVSRRTDAADRRRVVLSLTNKGETVYNEILPLSYAADRALLSALSDREACVLRALMRRLLDGSAETISPEQDWRSILSEFGYNLYGVDLASAQRVDRDGHGPEARGSELCEVDCGVFSGPRARA